MRTNAVLDAGLFLVLSLAHLSILLNSGIANGECANACSGHGECMLFDMCNCHRNWQAADCSERVCLFGRSWVDNPLGDLDSDGEVSGPDNLRVQNSFQYPYGTTEGFPASVDTDGVIQEQSAHRYAECSNAGVCNRLTGECECYELFTGGACERMICPGSEIHEETGEERYLECSGHGVCNDMKRLAMYADGDDYWLWDRESTQGCRCDAGYFGGDCSQRQCGYGLDPLYSDDTSAVKYSAYNFGLLTTSNSVDMALDMQNSLLPAQWAIRFYDVFGEDWLTQPIPLGASCTAVVSALESLPNNVVPRDSLTCYRLDVVDQSPLKEPVTGVWNITKDTVYQYHNLAPGVYGPKTEYFVYKPAYWRAGYANSYDVMSGGDNTLSGYIYRIEFLGVLGYLPQPSISLFTDGSRRTMHSQGELFTDVWTNGEQGENFDYIAEHCAGVSVYIQNDQNGNYWISGMTGSEEDILKQCLGDADDDKSNNVEIDDWDFGDVYHPHLIKLVPSSGEKFNWGFYAVVYYDINFKVFVGGLATTGTFRFVNPIRAATWVKKMQFDVFATKGTMSLTSTKAEVVFDFASNILYTLNVDYGNLGETYNGDISCSQTENGVSNDNILQCIEKNDFIMMFDFHDPRNNPAHLNMYRVKKIYSVPDTEYIGDSWDACKTRDINGACTETITEGMRASTSAQYRVHRIITDLSTNWAKDLDENSQFRVYKFTPHKDSAYHMVAPCANRGMCNYENGLCECNKGYEGPYCEIQSTILY